MAAFFQNLLKKRSTSATGPDSSKPKPSRGRKEEGPDREEAAGSKGPEQSAIDSQRAILADSNTTQEALAELAIKGLAVDIRLEAAQRLTDESLLQQVQKAARGRDKGVYQHVRGVLQELRRNEDEQKATQDALARLAREAEELARTGDTNLYEARTQKLEKQWQALETTASNEQKSRILAALHDCRQRVRDLEQERQEEQRHHNQKQQRDETLALLRETLDSLAEEAPATSALPSLDALQRTQENRWLEATRDTEVSRQEQKQYENLMQSLRGAISAVRRLGQHQEEIDTLTGQDKPSVEQVRPVLDQLEWPGHVAQPAAVRLLAEKAHIRPSEPVPDSGDADVREKILDRLSAALDKLEAALSANQLKESRQHLKQAQGLQRQLSGIAANHHRGRLQRLTGQVRELGDWRGFATEPKQVSLCEQMEYLAEQPMDPEAKATHIQELQQEWRELGGSSNRDLWQRFRKASDLAFKPCKAYFEARSDLKKVHLQKRHSICEELARYLEATDWSQVDWKAAEQIEKTARKEWRQAWPVEFRDNRQVQKEFDRLMNDLGNHLDEERHRNEALKQEIVERARSLIEHSPLSEAMNEAKALQKQWQDIGITRHREDRKLWKAFRAACDEIFARRDEQRQRRQQETSESDEAADQALARARDLLSQEELDEPPAVDVIQQLESAARTPVSSSKGNEIRSTAQELSGRLRQQRQRASVRQWQQWIDQRQQGQLSPDEVPGHWQQLQSTAELSDARELVVLSEILSGSPSPDDDQSLRMELQVRRLREGFGGSQAASDAQADTLETLVACWCLGLPDDSLTPGLASRLRQALDTGSST
ncbi:DUF349 domain-containing protein [Marinobacter sp. LN3S78]|uniref:DUF349 domain-containing protein n=1 Tax=Marinobacter sp. LN3S78 TaxID=3382300 RepID=UPI00387B77E5